MGKRGLFVLLCTLQYIQGMHGNGLIDSLTCVNNYMTYWKCEWKLNAEAHQLLPMNLLHWNSITSFRTSQRCEPDKTRENKNGEVYRTCQFNERFNYIMIMKCFFQPKRDVSRKTHITPNHNVWTSPPEGLMLQMSDSKNGSITLRWTMPENVLHPRRLLYQVAYYRKDWESWEDAAVLNIIGKTEISFSPELFVPVSTYLFRVRSIPDKDQRYRSAWSNHITWTVPEEEDKAIPQNLHCEYDGLTQIKCRWEVRQELNSVPYMLYYKDGDAAKTSAHEEKPCNNLSSHMEVGNLYAVYSCTFQIPSSQANTSFHIRVGPSREQKEFSVKDNIQVEPPTDLQIKNEFNLKYKLEWTPPKVAIFTIGLTYQLCYWKQGDEGCPDLLLMNVSGNIPEYYIHASDLLSSTCYIAKVRAKPDDKTGFNGPWSEWSQSYSWKTNPAVNTAAISVSTFIISVGFVLCIYLWFICFRRLKQKWDNSIPDPRKSKLSKFSQEYRGPNFPELISRDLYSEVEGPLVSLQISAIESPQPRCHGSEESVVETPSSASQVGPYSMAPPTLEKVQLLQVSSSLPQCEASRDLKGESILQPTNDGVIIERCSPYFIFTHPNSMSDLIAKESVSHKLSDYFMLPQSQNKVVSPAKEFIPSCKTLSPGNQMGYVLNMEKPLPMQIPVKDTDQQESKKNGYFSIPSPSEVPLPLEGPLMIINPDGTGPLVLKQVGDYCFFPGIRGSQENLEKKMAPANGNTYPEMPKDIHLPAVQTFKVMQRDYLALPQNEK